MEIFKHYSSDDKKYVRKKNYNCEHDMCAVCHNVVIEELRELLAYNINTNNIAKWKTSK